MTCSTQPCSGANGVHTRGVATLKPLAPPVFVQSRRSACLHKSLHGWVPPASTAGLQRSSPQIGLRGGCCRDARRRHGGKNGNLLGEMEEAKKYSIAGATFKLAAASKADAGADADVADTGEWLTDLVVIAGQNGSTMAQLCRSGPPRESRPCLSHQPVAGVDSSPNSGTIVPSDGYVVYMTTSVLGADLRRNFQCSPLLPAHGGRMQKKKS